MSEPQESPSKSSRREAMGNYFLLNPPDRWAAVCIAKNGCSTLKAEVLRRADIEAGNHDEIHNRIGYSDQSPFLSAIPDGPPEGHLKFAVWRDPVSRLASIYQQFVLDGVYQRRFDGKIGFGFDQFLNFAAWELRKDIKNQDEHLRAQSNYYRPEDVDVIVKIEDLDRFFEENNWLPPARKNPSSAKFFPTPRQIRRIRRLYEKDYSYQTCSFS